MWTEEEYTLNISSLPITELIFKSFYNDFNPPLYYICAQLSLLITGGVEFSIRYPSTICGILLIPTMFYLGKQYKDELTGLYCAGLTTIILPFIYYSQFGRAYSMSLLFFAIVLVLYLRLKDGVNDTFTRVAFWVMIPINLYTHLFVVIPLSLMCIDLLFDRRNWLCGIGATIASLPLVGMLVSVLSTRTHGAFDYGASPLQMIFLTFPEFFNTIFLNIIVLAGAGAWLYKNKINKMLILITVVTLIVGVMGASITPMFPRYLMSVAIVILLFCSVGMTELTTLLNKKVGKNLDYIVMIGVFVIFLWMMWPNLESHYFMQQYEC